jgi:hypothetical protein
VDVTKKTPPSEAALGRDVRSRALAMWPGLDRKKLTRTCGDPTRVTRLVERRTALPRESILRILEGRVSAGELLKRPD